MEMCVEKEKLGEQRSREKENIQVNGIRMH